MSGAHSADSHALGGAGDRDGGASGGKKPLAARKANYKKTLSTAEKGRVSAAGTAPPSCSSHWEECSTRFALLTPRLAAAAGPTQRSGAAAAREARGSHDVQASAGVRAQRRTGAAVSCARGVSDTLPAWLCISAPVDAVGEGEPRSAAVDLDAINAAVSLLDVSCALLPGPRRSATRGWRPGCVVC